MAKADEPWNFIHNKCQQKWLGYALYKLTEKIIVYKSGKRTDMTLQ